MVTTTTVYGFQKPTVAGDEDDWGGYLNNNIDKYESILTGNTTITSLVITTADINGGTLDNVVIGGTTAAAITGTTITASGNIVVSGTVDGRDIATDGTKLDGIESGATADQTKADIDALNINADQVDGLEASQFLRSDTSDTMTGDLTVSENLKADGGTLIMGDDAYSTSTSYVGMKTSNMSGSTDYMIISGHSDGNTYISAKSGNDVVINGGGNVTTYGIKVYPDQNPTVGTSSYTIWHSGNDGSGSGLDADTLDGVQGSSYLRSDTNDTFTGTLTVSGTVTADGLTVDTNTLHVDATNNRVGINDTSPARELEILGTANATTYLRISGTSGNVADTNYAGIEFYNTDASGKGPNVAAFIEARSRQDGYGQAGQLVFATASSGSTPEGERATQRLRIADNGDISFYEDTSTTAKFFWDASTERLGIGNSAPTTALDVTGTVTADSVNIDGDLNAVDNIYVATNIYHEGDTNTYIGFRTDAIDLYTGGTQAAFSSSGLFITDGSVAEDYDALSGTTPTCNVDNGAMFSLTMTGNTTFTFSGASSGYIQGFVLQLTGNGSTVTYPTSVDWAGGTAPDAPANGETDILVFITRDGGTTWYGALAIDAAA